MVWALRACGQGSCRTSPWHREATPWKHGFYPRWVGIGATDISPGHDVRKHARKGGIITVRGLPTTPCLSRGGGRGRLCRPGLGLSGRGTRHEVAGSQRKGHVAVAALTGLLKTAL